MASERFLVEVSRIILGVEGAILLLVRGVRAHQLVLVWGKTPLTLHLRGGAYLVVFGGGLLLQALRRVRVNAEEAGAALGEDDFLWSWPSPDWPSHKVLASIAFGRCQIGVISLSISHHLKFRFSATPRDDGGLSLELNHFLSFSHIHWG